MLEPDYFERKRKELRLDRGDTLGRVQQWLDARYPGKVRAKSLNRDILRLVTPSSSLAGELRMTQVAFLQAVELPDVKLAITVGSID